MPVAHSATGDLNHYDRYFFNGYPAGGELYFAAAMGLYPNRHVADAAFSVVVGGRQHSVFRSQRAPHDRRDATTLGPIVVEVDEPLKLRVQGRRRRSGPARRLCCSSPLGALEEPHFFQRIGARTWFDYTRLTQFGEWTGWVEVDGDTPRGVGPTKVWGSRDRSWGIRPVGEPAPTGAPGGSAPVLLAVGAGELRRPGDALRRQRVRRRPPLARDRRPGRRRRGTADDARRGLPRHLGARHPLGRLSSSTTCSAGTARSTR